MQQHLEFKCLGVLVCNHYRCVQTILLESHTVDQVEVIGPEALGVFVERGRTQAKVELDIGITRALCLAAVGRGFGSRLSEELPSAVARETMLGQLGCSGVVGCGAEDLIFSQTLVRNVFIHEPPPHLSQNIHKIDGIK